MSRFGKLRKRLRAIFPTADLDWIKESNHEWTSPEDDVIDRWWMWWHHQPEEVFTLSPTTTTEERVDDIPF